MERVELFNCDGAILFIPLNFYATYVTYTRFLESVQLIILNDYQF